MEPTDPHQNVTLPIQRPLAHRAHSNRRRATRSHAEFFGIVPRRLVVKTTMDDNRTVALVGITVVGTRSRIRLCISTSDVQKSRASTIFVAADARRRHESPLSMVGEQPNAVSVGRRGGPTRKRRRQRVRDSPPAVAPIAVQTAPPATTTTSGRFDVIQRPPSSSTSTLASSSLSFVVDTTGRQSTFRRSLIRRRLFVCVSGLQMHVQQT